MRKGIRKVKRGIAVLLSACMVFSMTPIQAGAEETVSGNETQAETLQTGSESSDVYELTLENGEYYDSQHVKYTLSTDGTATVAKCDKNYISSLYSDEQVEADNGWEITIPAKVSYGEKEYEVTKVGNSAFDGCRQLTKVDFPDNSVLAEIGTWAFCECSFKSITLPDSLTTIKSEAFSDNVKLQSIYIPRNVSSIGAAICCNNAQLVKIEVDQNNKTYNVGLGDVNCIVKNTGGKGTLIQGCSTSVIPSNVIEITDLAFCGMDIRNIDFSNCSKIIIGTGTFTSSIMPNDWKIPVCFENVDFSSNLSLKKLTIHDEYIYLGIHNGYDGLLSYCTNLEEVVIPASVNYDSAFNDSTYNKELFGGGCGTENLTVYVGDFSQNNGLFKSLKAHAYEDYTGDEVVTYEKTETRHYILKKAYCVQLAEDYAGYTLTKAKGCTTLTPIPGDSVRFVINAEDDYKKNVTVYVTDDSGNKTELTKDADGVYTLNNVNENNYKISLENYGECGHESIFTYTLGTDESGNSIIIKKCDECGYEERGNVTATWRHGVKNVDSIAFYCDNANIKGTYAVTEAVADGKSAYNYRFTPIDGTCTGNGSVAVTEKTEDTVSKTVNGITYSTIKSENDITNPLGNCTADIYYDSEDNVLHINGSETYVVSGTTTVDRIVVNNMKPTTLVLSGLDIQMTVLPAIDLQGTADVKIVLAGKKENVLKSGGDYAALQKNDLTKNTPKLSIYGKGSLNAEASGDGAGIGAQSGKTASNITFQNATITVSSVNGCGIGNGSNDKKDDSNFSSGDYIINGGKVMAVSNRFWGISGGITVDGGAVVRDYNYFRSSDKFESSTNVIKGFICRYSFGREAYSKIVGDATVDFQFNGDGLEIPEDSILTIGYGGQIFNRNGIVANYGTFILKGNVGTLNSITNNGIFYNYSLNGNSLKDKVTGSGTLHEDTDHDGLCDICGDDIGNVIVEYDENVTITQGDNLTLSAAVTPKESSEDKEITYQWYESDVDGNYTKISGATTAEYVQENCSLDVGEHIYRLQVLCDGIIRYIPFTVTVNEKINVRYDTYSLTLGDEIGVNFYMNIPEAARTEDAYMEFSVSGKGGRTTEIRLADITAEKDGRYRFTCLVNAIQMAETVTATFHYGENKTVVNSYSVKQYVEAIVADDTQPEYVMDLVKALADYGYYAQLCLSDANGWTLGEDYAQMIHYTDSMDTSIDLSKYAYSREGEVSGITGVSRSLSLDSKTAINLYFAFDDSLTEAPTFEVKDKDGNIVEYELTLVDNRSRYLLKIPGISAHKLGDTYTVTVNGTMTIKTSALSYAYAVLNSDQTNAATKNAVAALYEYYETTMAYRKAVYPSLEVDYQGIWERWGTNGGKGLVQASWSNINGTITLDITFNDSVDDVETDDASVRKSWSGKNVTLTFASTVTNPLSIGIHLNHGTSIDDLKITGFSYTVN